MLTKIAHFKFMVTLVLLPGLEGTGDLFLPLANILQQGYELQIVRYPPSTPMGYDELQNFVNELLPKEGPLILLGESFSGPLAIALAAQHSMRVKGIILSCTFVRNPYRFLSIFSSIIKSFPLAHTSKRMLDFACFGRFSTPVLRNMLFRALASVDQATLNRRVQAVLQVDMSRELLKIANLKLPLLYLQARRDHIVPKGAGKLIKKIYPASKFLIFEAPHCLLQTMPFEVAQVIREFITSLSEIDKAGFRFPLV